MFQVQNIQFKNNNFCFLTMFNFQHSQTKQQEQQELEQLAEISSKNPMI